MSDASPLYERVENLLRDPQPFRDWLDTREPDANVGLSRSDGCNPLTEFLREHADAVVSVGNTYIYHGVTYLPRWAQRFMAEIHNTPSLQITAAEARQALEAALNPGES